jgi:hypothetical protein
MAFRENDSEGQLSEEIQAENDKYGVLMILQKEPIEGIYRGFKECPGYGGKGTQKSHLFESTDGTEFKVRGFGLMDHIIAKDYVEGDLLRVTYTGKGDDGYHKCKIAKDDGSPDNGEEL